MESGFTEIKRIVAYNDPLPWPGCRKGGFGLGVGLSIISPIPFFNPKSTLSKNYMTKALHLLFKCYYQKN